MGYTHYFTFKKAPKGQAEQTEKQYQLAIRQCQRVVKYYQSTVKAIDSKHPDRLSGYSAYCKVDQYGGLNFNGTKELAHEDFILREHFSQNQGFNFCKTAEKPYDVVVTACLIVLKSYLGHLVDVSSDGYQVNWTDGLKLAVNALNMVKLSIPSSIESRYTLKVVN